MRSARVTPNTVATPSDYNALLNDSTGAARLLAHQMFGTIALPTNPSNSQTLTLDINGTNVVITFVGSIGSTAGNVLIGASAAATMANLIQLLLNPTITNSTQVALGVNTAAAVTLVNYINWSNTGTSIIASSYNATLYAPVTSFSASTTATGGSYTANTMALYVEPGVVYVGGTRVIFSGGVSPTVTAPSSHPRIDVLSVDNTGTLAWTTGTENASPVAPTYPANKVALCELYNVVGETALYDNANQQSGEGYISTDVRPLMGNAVNLLAIPSNLIPDATDTRDLGASGTEWDHIYGKYLYGDGSNITNLLASFLGFNTTFDTTYTIGTPMRVQLGLQTLFSGNGTGADDIFGQTGANPQTKAIGIKIAGGTYLGAIAVYMKAINTPLDSVGCTLQSDSGGHPSGTVLATFPSIAASSMSSSYTLQTFTLASPHLIAANTQYWLVFARTGSLSVSTYYSIQTDGNRVGSTPGNGSVATFASSSWTVYSAGTPLINGSVTWQDGTAGQFTNAKSDIAYDAMCIGITIPASASSGTIATNGYITGLSGLTPATAYYLQDNGTLGTSPGTISVLVGFALTATTMILQSPTPY